MSQESDLVKVLGENLLGKDGLIKTESLDANNKVIMLYFSAHWCPPCKQFTPMFARFYGKHKEKIEVIFVSGDENEEAFDSYYKDHPWLAMPYAQKKHVEAQFKVDGIPTVLLLNGKGEVYSRKGREIVMDDPEAANFPWVPKTIAETLAGESFVKNDGSKIPVTDLENKYVGLYFSAHWCPPCKRFTPLLAAAYKKIVETRDDFEIVFVSSDRDEDQFKEYFSEMPWTALPFDKRNKKKELSSLFEVEGIPSLVILDKGDHNKVLNKAAVMRVMNDPDVEDFPWEPKPVQSLSEGVGDMNEMPSLVVMMEKENDTTGKQFEAVLAEVASKHKDDLENGKINEKIQFLMGGKEDAAISTQIRHLTKLTSIESETRTLCNGDMCLKLDNSTAVILLNIPDDGAFYKLDGELTQDNLNKFVENFAKGDLERLQLKK